MRSRTIDVGRRLARLRAPAALCCALVPCAIAPATASAHAQLEATSPQRGTVVATQPRIVSFRFGEPVTGTAGAVRVFDARGERVDDGASRHPGGDPRSYGVGLRPGLPKGTYTATYRVVSADTHVVTGGLVFSIGAAGAAPAATVGQLLAHQRTGTVTSTAFDAARAVQYGSIGIAAGGLLFLFAVWLPVLLRVADADDEWSAASGAFTGRLRLLLVIVATAGLLSALAGLVLEGAEAAGVPFGSAIDGTIVGDVLGTRFGVVWLAAAAAWLLLALGAALLLDPRSPRAPVRQLDGAPPAAWPAALLCLPAALLLSLPTLAGHASIQHPVWLFAPANLVHVSAMAAWFGGLMVLLAVMPAATRRLASADRTPLLAATLARFSPIALLAVIALALSGTAEALIQIDSWSELLHTAFGRAVLIKILLLLALIALGAVNRRRTVPRLQGLAAQHASPGEAGILLRRTLRAEVALIVVVLAVTGALAGYAPAKYLASGPVSVTTSLGPEQMNIDVDPARVGANVIHIYLLDPRSGAQFAGTKQLTVTATQKARGIGPLPLDAQLTGPGHYTVPDAVLGAPGTWTIDVTARVSTFDQYEQAVKVPIR
jgi:copper transport protein